MSYSGRAPDTFEGIGNGVAACRRLPDYTSIRVPGALVVWLCQGKCLDDPSRTSRNDKALVKSAFQSLTRPVGLTWKSLYESEWSPTALKGCVVRGAVHPRCCRPSPVRFIAPVRLLAAARCRINGLGSDVRIDTEPSYNVRWNERSSPRTLETRVTIVHAVCCPSHRVCTICCRTNATRR